MKRPLSQEDVRTILPHRDVMLLCRTATVDGEGGATAEFPIEPESWADRLSCPHLYLVEALAQLCGLALAGTRLAEGIGPSRGYLAEASEIEFSGSLTPGSTAGLVVSREISFGPLHRFEVTAGRGDEVLVKGVLTVATA